MTHDGGERDGRRRRPVRPDHGAEATGSSIPPEPAADQLTQELDEERRRLGARGIGTTSWRASSFQIASRDKRRRRVDSLSFSSIGPRRAWSAEIDDLGQPEPVALGAQIADRQQRLGRRRQRAVAVLPLGADVVDLGRRRDGGQAPVRLEAQLLLGDVVRREVGVGRHVELDLGRRPDRRALHLGHRLGDHLAVEVVADGGDVARLRLAEQVAGAADLEVAHGDLEPAAELGRLADRLQPLVRLLGQHDVDGVEEVGVGPLPAATDAARAAGAAGRGRAGPSARRRAC